MEHIVYLIAVNNIIDLKYVEKHAKKLDKKLSQERGLTYDFGAIVVANWKKNYGEAICIGDNRLDSLIFYSNKDFIKKLDEFSYLRLKDSYKKSVLSAYNRFFEHEKRITSNADNYHLIVCDFRDEADFLVGNEADEILESFKTQFSDVSQISILIKDGNREAYERLVELMPVLQKRIFSINAHGRLSPMSKDSINIILGSLN